MQDTTLTWRKSSRSGAAGHCVEVAEAPATVLVRDSKDVKGPVLSFGAQNWTGFIAGVRAGEFDRPGV
jgi:predicted secreted Zn-dependent protease